MYSSEPIDESSSKIPNERRVLTWLRKRIHPYCWGQSDHRKENFRRTTRRQVLSFFRGRRFDLPGGYLPKMTNRMMMGHFAGQRILYFQADGKYSVPETLICTDIDCHDRGTYEGACACVKWLVDNGFPDLFWSRSTNGRGVHAYLRVDKSETNDIGLDQALLALERWLKYQHSEQKWDIQDIEVKGRPPIFHWGDERHELRGVKMGSLAKLPIDALDRPNELLNTTLKRVDELSRLGGEVPGDSTQVKREEYCTTYSVSISPDPAEGFGIIDERELREIPFTPDMRNREWPLWVEAMSKHGLQEEDSVTEVIFELSKWLLWVELYDQDDKVERTIELLQVFVCGKHNGFVSRVNDGRFAEVLTQVDRIVEGASDQSAESKELFCRVRQRRDQGKYRRVINIAPFLGGECTQEQHDREEYCTTYSVSISTPLDDPVPAEIESIIVEFARSNRMQVRDGLYPILRFARRMLNHLWGRKGSARIHRDILAGWAGGVNQQNRYKKVLLGLKIIGGWEGTYRSKAASSLYKMSRVTRDAFEARFREQAQSDVG